MPLSLQAGSYLLRVHLTSDKYEDTASWRGGGGGRERRMEEQWERGVGREVHVHIMLAKLVREES